MFLPPLLILMPPLATTTCRRPRPLPLPRYLGALLCLSRRRPRFPSKPHPFSISDEFPCTSTPNPKSSEPCWIPTLISLPHLHLRRRGEPHHHRLRCGPFITSPELSRPAAPPLSPARSASCPMVSPQRIVLVSRHQR
jgi:hypothetical protein